MKVKELIEKLALENPELKVVVNGYECGYDEVEMCRSVKMNKNTRVDEKTWEGEYEECFGETCQEVAVLLPRKS